MEGDVKKDKRKEVVNEKKVKIKDELGPVRTVLSRTNRLGTPIVLSFR